MSIDYWDPEQESLPPRPPNRWLRRSCGLILLASLIIVISFVGPSMYLRWEGSGQLTQVLAATDARDPNWRWDALHSARADVADADNAALRVLAIQKLIPEHWPSDTELEARQTVEPVAFSMRIRWLEPHMGLTDEQLQYLSNEIERAMPALKEARLLAKLPSGRFPAQEHELPQSNVEFNAVRVVADLLSWDALDRAQRGDWDGATSSLEAMFNVFRSMGDEPGLRTTGNRARFYCAGARTLERVLAQGQLPPSHLERMQKLLDDELNQPQLLRGLRGERACTHEILERFRQGEAPALKAMFEPLGLNQNGDWAFHIRHWLGNGYWQDSHARYLEFLNRAIDIADQPVDRQRAGFVQLDREIELMKMCMKDSPKSILSSYFLAFEPRGILTMSPMWRVTRSVHELHRSQAMLRASAVAVAAERFRQAVGRWPNDVAELAPRFLTTTPTDLFSRGGSPLRLRRLPDGIVIYSIGSDGEDNDGSLARQQGVTAGADLGMQLWDVSYRHAEQKPVLPVKKAE